MQPLRCFFQGRIIAPNAVTLCSAPSIKTRGSALSRSTHCWMVTTSGPSAGPRTPIWGRRVSSCRVGIAWARRRTWASLAVRGRAGRCVGERGGACGRAGRCVGERGGAWASGAVRGRAGRCVVERGGAWSSGAVRVGERGGACGYIGASSVFRSSSIGRLRIVIFSKMLRLYNKHVQLLCDGNREFFYLLTLHTSRCTLFYPAVSLSLTDPLTCVTPLRRGR